MHRFRLLMWPTVNEDGSVSIQALNNDSDADSNDSLQISAVSVVGNKGTVRISGNEIVFDTNAQFESLSTGESELVAVNYTIRDSSGAESSSTIQVTVTGVNDTPILVVDEVLSTDKETVKTIDVLANDSDPEDQTLTLVSANVVGLKGSVSIIANELRFDPSGDFASLLPNQSESVVIAYVVQDSLGAQSQSTVTLRVIGINRNPVADDDAAIVGEDSSVRVSLTSGDSDSDGNLDVSTVEVLTNPSFGSVTVNADGTVDYIHDGSENFSDSFYLSSF